MVIHYERAHPLAVLEKHHVKVYRQEFICEGLLRRSTSAAFQPHGDIHFLYLLHLHPFHFSILRV